MQSTAEPNETRAELGVQDALVVATQMHRDGNLDDAATLYARILDVCGEHADALHFLGVLRHQTGRSREAIELIIRAIELAPDAPDPWNNLANVYVQCRRVDDAIRAYGHCLQLAPAFADAHNNLGTLHRSRSEWALAEACYLRAVDARPNFPDAYNNLSKLMIAQGRSREAVIYACRTITMLPHDPEARRLLGFAYYTLGENDKAADIFRQWLIDDPTHPIALHHLAACTGENVPDRAADAYVRNTFDAFAGSFDAKLEILGYRAPQVVAASLAAAYGAPRADLDVLDAGCGTGLCGPLVREYSRHLVGIDLSQRMLDKARARGVYDALEAAELLAFVSHRRAGFDAIVSADTLCYFGRLDVFARFSVGALRDGGMLFATVEALPEHDDADYRLLAHGRYAHGRSYVETCVVEAGFEEVTLVSEELRREGGLPVTGWMVTGRKPRSAAAQLDGGSVDGGR